MPIKIDVVELISLWKCLEKVKEKKKKKNNLRSQGSSYKWWEYGPGDKFEM